ncbi:PH domain-containing protein [Quadrisphaera granulorum]|uniref:PH (Pleckstrin Homology) domain-containing protein n=1 Tax=Quadrisphaera granulorum TaxID=317664 RepID=A0A316AED3_9ACTN|nr:PH (Pleckstrin Homology) domain-containing protein [Quadrisphaera granulorum]SZE98506.1 PH domain-containing protein [Quadrisphaera granulorum]
MVLRSTVGVVATALAVVVALGLVLQALLAGRADTVLAAGPWLLAGVWVMVLFLARPHVALDRDGARVVTVLRRHHLPWGAVRDATVRPHVRFQLRDGRRIASWDTSRHDADDSLGAAVTSWIDTHDGEPQTARSRWDTTALAGTAVVVVLCAVSVLA